MNRKRDYTYTISAIFEWCNIYSFILYKPCDDYLDVRQSSSGQTRVCGNVAVCAKCEHVLTNWAIRFPDVSSFVFDMSLGRITCIAINTGIVFVHGFEEWVVRIKDWFCFGASHGWTVLCLLTEDLRCPKWGMLHVFNFAVYKVVGVHCRSRA